MVLPYRRGRGSTRLDFDFTKLLHDDCLESVNERPFILVILVLPKLSQLLEFDILGAAIGFLTE